MTRQFRTPNESDMDAMITRYGWAVQGVFDNPPFAYTVGLAAKGLPEIIVFGLRQETMKTFLNILGRRFTTEGVPPLDTDLLDVAEGYPARLLPVPRAEAEKFMFQAQYRYPDYTAVQLVWTDQRSRFPWDAGFEPLMVPLQPVLGARVN